MDKNASPSSRTMALEKENVELKQQLQAKDKALDKLSKQTARMCKQTKCKDCHFVIEQETEDNDCPVQGNCCGYD